MKRFAGVAIGMLLVVAGVMGFTQAGFHDIKETLTGYEEVIPNVGGAVSTTGQGEFVARINPRETEIEYTLSYDGLEGVVTQSHIHFGQRSTTGSIVVWLCGSATNPGPVGTPLCPAPGDSVSGVLTAGSVGAGATGQGIEAGAFSELVDAIRAGATYVNVHSSKWPAGEVRSQIGHDGH